MNEEQLKLADLSSVKVGDTIWTIQKGDLVVSQVSQDTDPYIILTSYGSYTIDGRVSATHLYPTAFTKNPFENVGFQERWMMVSDDEKEWVKRFVFMQKNGSHIAWFTAETDEEVSEETDTTTWIYAKEIEEPKELELTLEQIAEKFGVSVEQIAEKFGVSVESIKIKK